jgi:hypothetical protein
MVKSEKIIDKVPGSLPGPPKAGDDKHDSLLKRNID